MSLEELKAYANLYNCEDSSSDEELSGGSLMGGKLTRKNLIRMMQGGTLTGGAANEWITFMKTYKESKPEAKMDEIRNAYYESRGENVPAKKSKKNKNEGYSLRYLLSQNVKPSERKQLKEMEYLNEVFESAKNAYNDKNLKSLSTVIIHDEDKLLNDLKSYSQSMAKLNKAERKVKLAEKRLQKSLKNPNSRASKALLGEAIIHKKKAAPDFPLKAEAGLEDLINSMKGYLP